MGLALRPTLRGARGWPRNWITQFVMLANFQRSFGANARIREQDTRAVKPP